MNFEQVFYIIAAIAVVLLWLYLNGFRNWLVHAVTEAEAALGSKTGQLKLRMAYDMAVERYPVLAKIMPYAVFNWFVGSALKIMNEMLTKNKTIAEIVQGKIEEATGEADGR